MASGPRPTILLLGHSGQVGWELQRSLAPLGPLRAVDYPEIDLGAPGSLRELVRQVQPAVIVNAAAYTAVDRAEAESDLAQRVNGDAPGVLAEEARRLGALLVHYSTDYIFDGAKTVPYIEDDPPHPLNVYGHSKLAGDQAVAAAAGNHLIFRLCWVYGRRGQNFFRTIQRLAREREVLRVVADQWGSPTWSRLIAEATTCALARVLAAPDAGSFTGTYHLSSAGWTSWHGFAQAIVTALPAEARRCREVVPITSAEYPVPARRPAYSVLSGAKLERVFGLRLPAWDEAFRVVLAEESL